VADFRYLGSAATDQTCIHEGIKKIKFGECLLPFSSESAFLPHIYERE